MSSIKIKTKRIRTVLGVFAQHVSFVGRTKKRDGKEKKSWVLGKEKFSEEIEIAEVTKYWQVWYLKNIKNCK
jgi:hypothetical protein